MAFNNWPYTDFHDLNLSWLLDVVRVLDTKVQVIEKIINNGGGGGSAVTSVNGKTGAVNLDASDVGALPTNALTGYATQNWVRNQGYQNAQDVQSAVEEAAELPTGGSTGDFLRKTASGVAWETVPSAESNSFGGGS